MRQGRVTPALHAQKGADMQTKVPKETKANKAMTTQQLVEHIKAVGQAIIDDADKIAFDANDLAAIVIYAEIAAGKQVTTVDYCLQRLADPRIGKDNDGRAEET